MHQWNQIEVYRSSNSSRSTSNMGERACVGALVPSQRDCPFTALSIAGLSVRRRNFREERVVRDRDACHLALECLYPLNENKPPWEHMWSAVNDSTAL